MPRPKKLSLSLKEDLIAITRNILKSEGLKGLDVRKISTSAGCSVGTFYNHFKSLEELILHFNIISLDLLRSLIVDSISPTDNADAVIKKICSSYIGFAKNNQPEWFLLLEYRIDTKVPDWYQNKVDLFFQDIFSIFRPILEGSKSNIEKGVKILWGSLHGICSLSMKDKFRDEGLDPLDLSQNLFRNYIIGHNQAHSHEKKSK